MSIVTIVLEEHRALVAQDTRSRLSGNDVIFDLSKLQVIPHLNLVLTVRGSSAQLAWLLQQQLAVAGSFDDAVEVAEIEAPRCVELLIKGEADLPSPPALPASGPQEIVLVGWSPCAQRMVAWRGWANDGKFEWGELRGVFAAPLPSAGPFSPFGQRIVDGYLPSTDADLLALAREQVAFGEQLAPEMAWGGRLTIAEVRRDSVSLRQAELSAPLPLPKYAAICRARAAREAAPT
ncbi:MAG: hypothetical protein U1F67_10450 [Rubrivivax sp.]